MKPQPVNDLMPRVAGLLACGVVAFPLAQTIAESPAVIREPLVALGFAIWVAFTVLFWVTTSHDERGPEKRVFLYLAIESVLALFFIAVLQISFSPILLVLVAAQIAYVVDERNAMLWITGQMVGHWMIDQWIHGNRYAVFGAVAFGSFQIFAAFTSLLRRREEEARLELARVNAELTAATEVLEVSSRLAERTRISRDLHDTIGHHIAALSLNLEVAKNVADGEAREQVQASQDIAKDLLAEVRNTVSRLRSEAPPELEASLQRMAAAFPAPKIDVQIDDDLDLEDPLLGEVVLRVCQEAITNAARHSAADNVTLLVRRMGEKVVVDANDDGHGAEEVAFGNGLRGMRERVEGAGGKLDFVTSPGNGFSITATIPLREGGVS